MMHRDLHKKLCQHRNRLEEWFEDKSHGLMFPIYSSFDLRDSNFKVAPVDANLFPAGFNNICDTDKEWAEELFQKYLRAYYPNVGSRIVLLTEEHTKNAYYWDNVASLVDMMKGAGAEVVVAMPQSFAEPLKVPTASGREVVVHSAVRRDGGVWVDEDYCADLIVSNNDFSREYPEFMQGLETPMNPPYELGWYRRKKHHFFSLYNELALELSKMIELDPWLLQIRTQHFVDFDVSSEVSRERLAKEVDDFLFLLRRDLEERQIDHPAFVFIKNNAGTYGLGVTRVSSGEEVLQWTYKARKKMKASKGGGGFNDVIIQEGVPSGLASEGETQEPVIYMVGCQLAGGFLRTHSQKGPSESLNSPGAVYKRMCVADLNINVEGCPMENVYGWLARLAALAAAREATQGGGEPVAPPLNSQGKSSF